MGSVLAEKVCARNAVAVMMGRKTFTIADELGAFEESCSLYLHKELHQKNLRS